MVLGETGSFPLSIAIKTRMIFFWCKLITSDANRISTTLYNLLQICNVNNNLRYLAPTLLRYSMVRTIEYLRSVGAK